MLNKNKQGSSDTAGTGQKVFTPPNKNSNIIKKSIVFSSKYNLFFLLVLRDMQMQNRHEHGR